MHYPAEMERALTLVTPPGGVPITLAQAKSQLRIDHGDDDDYIAKTLIPVAVDYLDPAGGGWLGYALVQQQWQLALDRFPGRGWRLPRFAGFHGHGAAIALPFPPLISVDAVTYLDPTGALQTLDPTLYQVAGVGSRRGRIVPAVGQTWPDMQIGAVEAVKIKFTCGHAPTVGPPIDYGAGLPSPLKFALLMLISHWYENRDAVLIVSRLRSGIVEIPHAVGALLANLRVHY